MYTCNLHANTSRPCPIQSQSLKSATNYRNFTPTRHRAEQGEGILEKREFKERKVLLQRGRWETLIISNDDGP